ncbi:hypothetical protein ACFWVC_11445 [Streptomyces sp. NPDC058691]|uniref:hypothetical protein n=1 Tax=Streptomyces sp. NPDC058691 TaxID=3346601 RepID=UPI00364A27C7
MSEIEAELFPPSGPHAVDVVLQGPVEQVARVKAWINARSGEGGSSMVIDLPDGLVRCRMQVFAGEE